MYEVNKSYQNKINKLNEWRNRYSKDEYPYKVILNMFYDLFTTQKIWSQINESFSGYKKYSDFIDAFNEITSIRRNAQLDYVQPNLMKLLDDNKEAAGIKYSDYSELVSKAQGGDNHAVVEIEYSYWFYGSYNDATIIWAACGLLGFDKMSAYFEVTGGTVGGLRLDSFQDAIEFLPQILSMGSSFVDADGNPVDPIMDQGVKYYPKEFKLLPPLW
jgi:hypothetical protein